MFIYKRKAYFHETDRMGIIHHSNYIKWMEEARVAFMDAIGFSYASVENKGIVSPVVALQIEYTNPVEFDDEVEIRLQIEKYNGVRLRIRYEFFDRSKSRISAAASSEHCFLHEGRVVSLRKALPELDRVIYSYRDEETDSIVQS